MKLLRVVVGVVLASWAPAQMAWAQQGEVDLASMTFVEYEELALANDPGLARAEAQADALRSEALAAGAPPDPRVRIGVVNVPIDTFALDEEPMTQTVIGLQQMFPPIGSLSHSEGRLEAMAGAEAALIKERRLAVLRGIRSTWLELFYQFQAVQLIRETQQAFDELVQVTQFRYRSGRGNQHDVIRAELELSMLDDRVTRIDEQKDIVLVELGRWLGIPDLTSSIPVRFPDLPPLPTEQQVAEKLDRHPLLEAAAARVEAGREGVEVARSKYRPEFMVDLSYGQRVDRDDFVSGVVGVSLPLYWSKKQDNQLAASQREVDAALEMLENERRQLRETVGKEYVRWRRLDERLQRFDNQVLPYSSQYAQTSLKAYQSGVTDFTEQVRARLAELNNRLEALRVQVDRAKAHATLLYLSGDDTL